MFKYRFSVIPESIEKNIEKIDIDFSSVDSNDHYAGAILNPEYIENYEERIIWFLNYIKRKQSYTSGLDKGLILFVDKGLSPLIKSNYNYLTEEVENILKPIIQDKDFIRRYGFNEYKPSFDFDDHNVIIFYDFTDDFIDSYLEYKFGIKNSNNKEKDSRDEYYRVGNFEYKNHSLFVNDEKIKLSPQELLIMRKFMSDQVSGVKHYNYDDICDIISTKNRTKIDNMQKSMSKLRGKINKKTKDFSIESKSSDGYTFTIKNIR